MSATTPGCDVSRDPEGSSLWDADSEPRYRQATSDDARACNELMWSSVTDLAERERPLHHSLGQVRDSRCVDHPDEVELHAPGLEAVQRARTAVEHDRD
jgi:hypothetical protein